MDQNKPERAAPSTTIGHTIVIRGKLKSNEDLIVHGRIDAEITSAKAVLIEHAGVVKAGIRAESVSVSGILVGNAQADARMEISSGGRMVGDILAPTIVICDGAAFRGKMDMQTFDQSRVIDGADEPPVNGNNGHGLGYPPGVAAANAAFSADAEPTTAPDTAAKAASAPLSSFGSDDALTRPSTTNKQAEGAEAEDDDAYSSLNLGRKGKKKRGLF